VRAGARGEQGCLVLCNALEQRGLSNAISPNEPKAPAHWEAQGGVTQELCAAVGGEHVVAMQYHIAWPSTLALIHCVQVDRQRFELLLLVSLRIEPPERLLVFCCPGSFPLRTFAHFDLARAFNVSILGHTAVKATMIPARIRFLHLELLDACGLG